MYAPSPRLLRPLVRAAFTARFAFLALLAVNALGCGGGDDGGAAPTPPPAPPVPTFDYPLEDALRLNHLQAKGTHNSFHIKPELEIKEWRYTHAPLDVQLTSQGVRAVELDVWLNETEGAFEVYHVGIVDEVTTCRRLKECLTTLKNWSDASPAHHALFVQIEPKDMFYKETGEAYFTQLHKEILSVWPRERILTPDDVKGGAASVREAIETEGWPTLREARAKALFFLDEGGPFRDFYTRGGQDLDGRIIFAASDASTARPFDAVYVLNEPEGQADEIAAAVAAGFIVRTRADADSAEPLAGDTTRREAALASGAHVVSTDYPVPDGTLDYSVEIPDGTPSRCNPVTAPPECTPEAIDNPAFYK